ncbi:MAG: glycosyltransferase family 4 protein [Pyrinomonadaceae bacterium]|nr:glycosyltransferase family 4 protein [Pyrinomonadaceae bacterium]
MKTIVICSFPVEAAATRFRVAQFINSLAENDIDVTIRPYLDSEQFAMIYSGGRSLSRASSVLRSTIRRVGLLAEIRNFDLLFIQREAMIFGPAIFEWLYQRIGRLPMVLDLDDATYVRYVSPRFGRIGSFFKFFGKTDRLIDRADVVICGNRFIAEYVEKRGTKAVMIPTIVDTDVFTPVEKNNDPPLLGWIGTHSTFPFLERLLPVLAELAKKHKFKLRVVGSGRKEIEVEGVEVENLDWSLEREVSDFQTLDIGLYPLDTIGSLDPAWLAGKSGFKAIQYLAVGIPFVMSPIGVCAEIGESGKTHFNAETAEDWYNSLDRLLSDREMRFAMGKTGREFSLANYGLEQHAAVLAETLKSVVVSRQR